MADPTGPTPPFTGDETPYGYCAVGLRNVTIAFQNCSTGQGLFSWNLFLGYTSDVNHLVTTSNGLDYTIVYCVLPGIKYRVTNPGYEDTDFEITSQDVSSRTKMVCLKATPPPPRRPTGSGGCCFTTAAMLVPFAMAEDDATEAALDSLRTFRDSINGLGSGSQLVEMYYDQTVSKILTEAVNKDKDIALMVLALLLELQPFLFDLVIIRKWSELRLAEKVPPFMNLNRLNRIRPETIKRAVLLINRLEKFGKGEIKKPLMLLKQNLERSINLNVMEVIEILRMPRGL